MKRILAILVLFTLFIPSAFSQGGQSTAIRSGASLPSGASQWSVFVLTSGVTGLYQCDSAPCTSSSQWSFLGPTTGMPGRVVTTGTTDTLLSTDTTHFVIYNDGSSNVALTVPQAGSTGFGNSYTVPLINVGTGNISLSTTTSTINGSGSTATIYPSESCTLNTTDNANWLFRCTSLLSSTGLLPHSALPALVSGDIPNNAANTSGTSAGLSSNITESQVTNLTTDLAAKAPLASPALTGNPTAPTQAALNNSTRVSTTAYADAAVGVETSRAETAEGLLAPLASPTLTGNPTVPNQTALNSSTRAANTAYADAAVGVETTRAETAEGGKQSTLLGNTSVAVSSGTQGGNSCSSATTVTITGLTTTMVVSPGYSANPSALTGWGTSGGMVFQAWPSASNTLSWIVCNQTATSITYSAITFNVGAR